MKKSRIHGELLARAGVSRWGYLAALLWGGKSGRCGDPGQLGVGLSWSQPPGIGYRPASNLDDSRKGIFYGE